MSLSQFEEVFKSSQAYTHLWMGKALSHDDIFERLDGSQYVIDEVESAHIMWVLCTSKLQDSNTEVAQLNERYLGKMQEQQNQIAELQDTAEKLKDKLQALCDINFGEDGVDNSPIDNALAFDITTLVTYMKEREAFYQSWKDSRNSLSVTVENKTVELTGDEKQAYLQSVKDLLVKSMQEQNKQALYGAEPQTLKNDCMIDQTWFLKGSPVEALIKYAEDTYKAMTVAQNSKITFGTDDNVIWWAHDVPFYGRVQLEKFVEGGLVEWDIFFNECWQGPFNTKERAIQHLEECIAEQRSEMSNCANE